jgi:dienelactone hydrolase
MLDQSYFTYNSKEPIEFTILSERQADGVIIQDISYASPHGGKVSAYLIFPVEQAPEAGLIFGHWGEGNRDEFVDEAIILARLGFVSLCLDAPYRRPTEYEPKIEEPPQAELQWIVDVCRGVDLLQEQFKLPPEKLGYVGHSYSATYGGPIAAVEHRIKAYVLIAGWYALSELLRTTTNPAVVEERNATPKEEFDSYLAAMAPLDAIHYIGHAVPSHLFFQFARNDSFVSVEEGQRYFDVASEPKQITWYDNCDHELSSQARLDRVTWLCETLQLAQPSQEIVDMLSKVPAPVALPE